MNQFILMGRLAKDPEVKCKQPVMVVRYVLACDRPFSKSKENDTSFMPIVIFGKEAEFAQKYLKKGTKILVSGTIEPRSYEKDGKTIYTIDLVGQRQEFCERKQKE